MSLQLVYQDLVLPLDRPDKVVVTEAAGVQIMRCLTPGCSSGFVPRLLEAMTSLLDDDVRPPSEMEVMIATKIARTLDIPLPRDTLRCRGWTNEFSDQHRHLVDAWLTGKRGASDT